MKSFRKNIIEYGILLIVLALPLLFSENLAFPFMTIKTFFFYFVVELIFVFWIYNIIIDKSYRLTKNQLLFFIPVALYIVWMSIAGMFAVNPSLSFWSPLERGTGLLNLYHLFAFSLIIVSLINNKGADFINKILKYFLMGSFILAISIWFGDEGFNIPINILKKSQGGGLIGNSSLASAYLIFPFFIGIYLLFIEKISKSWKIFISIILVTVLFSPLFINIHGLFTGGSLLGSARGATLGIFIGLGVILLSFVALSKNKIMKVFGIVSILLSLIAFSIGWMQLMKPGTYINQKFTQAASGTRFLFWGIAQKAMNQHPYFGYGPENYMIAFRNNFDSRIFDDKYAHEAWSDKPHNIYYETGVASGYPGIAFYSLFLLSIFYGIYRLYKNGKISKIQAASLWGLFVGYIFQNLFVFDSPLSFMALFMLVGIIYGLQDEIIKEKNSKTNIDISLRNVVAGILSISFIFSSIYFTYMPLKKARNFVGVFTLPLDKRPAEYMSLLDGSPAGNDWDASFFAYNMYLKYNDQIKNLQNDKKIISYIDSDLTSYIKYLEKLSETNKTDYRLYLCMLHFYNLKMNIMNEHFTSEQLAHILSIADYSHKLNPMDPQVYWDVGFIKMYQGDLQGALVEYKSAINLDKTNKISWNMMLKFFKLTNQKDFYDITLNEALKNIPDFKMEDK